MLNFLQSIKTVFRGKKNDDDGQKGNQNNGDEKFSMSCKRKKKKKEVPNQQKSVVEPSQRTMKVVKPPARPSLTTAQPPRTESRPVVRTSAETGLTRNISLKMEPKQKPNRVFSQYVDIPKSTRVKSVKSRGMESSPDSRASSLEPTSSLMKFKEFSARAIRKVKTFVSRPLNEATLRKVAHRVEERKRHEQVKPTKPLTHGEDMFPKQKPVQRKRPASRVKEEVFPKVETEANLKSVIKVGQLPSGTSLVKNNDNGGELFLDKRGQRQPFWTATRRPTEEDNSDTEDDLQLNADVVLDVMNGKVKLVPMPSIPVILDPMNAMDQLQSHDKFFNKDVLFGNTVRTMINLNDPLSLRTIPRHFYLSYVEGTWTDFEKKPFVARQSSEAE